jgi:hypothetical protein
MPDVRQKHPAGRNPNAEADMQSFGLSLCFQYIGHAMINHFNLPDVQVHRMPYAIQIESAINQPILTDANEFPSGNVIFSPWE